MDQEKFNLQWSTFNDHLQKLLIDLKTSNNFTDVTLVCEDKVQFNSHKFVLCASSPVFKSIITDNAMINPVIYLKGIQSCELEPILQFIYLGQATFYKDRFDEFLSVANSLEIKEIFKNDEELGNIESHSLETEKCNEVVTNHDNENGIKKEFIIQQSVAEQDDLNETVKKCLQQVNITRENKPLPKYFSCEPCDVQYTCETSLYRHNKVIHKGFRYTCDLCDAKFIDNRDLHTHVKLVHLGISMYKCGNCNNQFTRKGSLTLHKQKSKCAKISNSTKDNSIGLNNLNNLVFK